MRPGSIVNDTRLERRRKPKMGKSLPMSFAVKEIFYTLQGEGAQVGRAAVFCRFAGCNLWSGLEEDRATAICDFCDTDFAGVDGPGGGRFANAQAMVEAIEAAWKSGVRGQGSGVGLLTPDSCLLTPGFVVCTGGEPLLQMTDELVHALHERGFEVAIETNGTKLPPAGIDWICVSPKANAELVLRSGNELKLIYPQPDAEPPRYERLDFAHFFLQPMDGPERERNTQLALRYCLEHPQWRLSLQTQKVLGIR
jgi:7-carboxy-7-deazaguanine synthase